MSATTEGACLRFPLSMYPGLSKFTRDWLASDPNATQFLGRPALQRHQSTGWSAAGPSESLVNALIESNRHWRRNVDDEVLRWAGGETFTVVAGQQAGAREQRRSIDEFKDITKYL